ncbi:Multidrug resistance-associated protein 1, partial [Borealophlyctis nickersoniae]
MFYAARRAGTRARSVINSEIYKKSLRRVQVAQSSTTSHEEDDDTEKEGTSTTPATTGKIVTLMSVDTERIRQSICYLHDPLLVTPLRILFATLALLIVLGLPALAGLAVMLVTIPLAAVLGKLATSMQAKLMKITDDRVALVSELLAGIKVVKFSAWEHAFASKISSLRDREISRLVYYYLTDCAFTTLWQTTPLVVAFATFAAFTVWSGQDLTATKAFTGLLLLNALRVPLVAFPNEVLELGMAV